MHQVLVSYIGGSNGVFQCPADPRRPFDGSSYDWNESFSGQLLDLVSPPWRS
jgi:hypothetical protein